MAGAYAAVRTHPEGESTAARLALTAAEYGYDGIAIRNHGDHPAEYDREEIADTYGIDVVTGVEVRAEGPGQATGFVGSHRDRATIVAVHGGDRKMNEWAVTQPAVDVLAHPTAGDDDGVDDVLARTAADNGVRLELSLASVLRAEGGTRVQAIQDLSRLWTLIETYETPYVVSIDPASHLALRAPRELAAVGEVIGVPGERIEAGLAEWGRLAERNRGRHSERFVEPGVWLSEES